jgi:hypothetical protein
MDEIGAKTKKLRAKQDYRDLVVINYRFQGVAEKIPETQETVLVRLTKLKVRSVKVLGMDLVAGISRSRGLAAKDLRHTIGSSRFRGA